MEETKSIKAGERTHTITAENVDQESFYNCTRLCAILGYANAPAAIKERNLSIVAVKDAGGNILRVVGGERIINPTAKIKISSEYNPCAGITDKKVWVVTAPSAYRPMHTCFLGRGATKQAALEDAYGPKAEWGNATRKSMRIADVYETDAATANELEHGSDE